MLARLPAALRGGLTGLLLGLNTLLVFSCMVPLALLKRLVPVDAVRSRCDRALNALASGWVAFNNAWIAAVSPARWDVQGVDSLNPRGWYLVSSNHQSWVDILVLQRIFHGHIPFLKFFLKQQLIWVPVMGLAWWALDFPFMRRHSEEYLKAHPEMRGRDQETTRKACEKFALVPTSVMNFLEGTRFTRTKHLRQQSPYLHLLKPKAGGLALALGAMGDKFQAILDITIAYPDGTPTFWHFLQGRMRRVVVRARLLPIPAHLMHADYAGDAQVRAAFGAWVQQLWREKDAQIETLLKS